MLDIDGFLKEDGVWVKGSSIDFLTTNFGLYVTAKEMENATQEDDLRRFLNYCKRSSKMISFWPQIDRFF
ncbi:hypothetical protein [Desulfitobacterium dichloroeliminans]|uniref:hypothetical protein n=1 Tax=Desulfitobacterium dichloroeliminans TaxID=233055 RepID=UPI00155ADE2F|nr:hypothetical protein [Desulfitobacterium dichloroeliminans]